MSCSDSSDALSSAIRLRWKWPWRSMNVPLHMWGSLETQLDSSPMSVFSWSGTWFYYQFSFESIGEWDDSAILSWPGITWFLTDSLVRGLGKKQILSHTGWQRKEHRQILNHWTTREVPLLLVFNLHFSNSSWCSISFHVLICHPCIFLSAGLVQFCGPFWIGSLVCLLWSFQDALYSGYKFFITCVL